MPALDAAGAVASRATRGRPAETAYRRALALFFGSLAASAVPAFLSSGVALLDAPWGFVLPFAGAYVALAVVCARAVVRERRDRRAQRRGPLDAVLRFAIAILFAGVGGATLAWESIRFLDHQLDQQPPHDATARRAHVDRGGRGTRTVFQLQAPERAGAFTLTDDAPPEAMVVRVYPGALGYRWLATR